MKKILHALLLFLTIAGYSQETRTITGIILDESDKSPIPGASIFVENNSISNKTSMAGIIESSTIGTTTDFDGKFQLRIAKNVTSLRVNFMGYISYTLELSSSQKDYTVNLKSETAKLGRSVSSSLAFPSSSQDLRKSNIPSKSISTWKITRSILPAINSLIEDSF